MTELDLFSDADAPLPLPAGAKRLEGFALDWENELLAEIARVIDAAPLRNMVTPGGQTMSVGMTNCGALGWVSDRRGYRYSSLDPQTGRPWPMLPPSIRRLAAEAAEAAGYPRFDPDA